MAGVSAQGGSFSFSGTGVSFSAQITGIAVETPSAEIVDMTGMYDATGNIVAVPTGDRRGGSVSVDYIHGGAAFGDPQTIVGKRGTLSFSSSNYSVSRNAILESATHGTRVGELVRGTVKFVLTDYTGS